MSARKPPESLYDVETHDDLVTGFIAAVRTRSGLEGAEGVMQGRAVNQERSSHHSGGEDRQL
jgi:hypothetical protein